MPFIWNPSVPGFGYIISDSTPNVAIPVPESAAWVTETVWVAVPGAERVMVAERVDVDELWVTVNVTVASPVPVAGVIESQG